MQTGVISETDRDTARAANSGAANSGAADSGAANSGADGFGAAAGAGQEGQEGLVGLLGSLLQTLTGTVDHPTWSLPETHIGPALALAQQIRAAADTLTLVLAAEADTRGLGTDQALSRPDWLRTAAPQLEPAAAPTLARIATAMNQPRWHALSTGITTGTITPAQAGLILRFHDDLARIADPDHLEAITTAMLHACPALSLRELGRLATHARATLKPPTELEATDTGLRHGRALTRLRATTAGYTEYRLRLDPEGAAILEAAIDPLARPRPDHCHPAHDAHDADPGDPPDRERNGAFDVPDRDGTGERANRDADPDRDWERDPRTPATRRADALLELIGRAVAAPQGVTRTPRTQLVITMTYQALLEQLRGAGITGTDTVLSPGTVRRLACEATILPAVLAGPSQLLDLGRTTRCFTPAQRLALALRDHGCSYPGCTIPPQWCDAHHVVPWIQGGPTDLTNGALLCGRHHTLVHQRRLTATITDTGITWHL
jgi:hypothetical protein